ncbi:adenylosuccinate lyase [Entomoplasma freundtii]|uniref:Adenylosuccinate lyase n=1 Tax=Entomoplasma freundtii TaxID=74700 RepID=A0A2K8NQL7_9MOLU|nr:adenylosuccinate lyase [Entomoplasma freundtii]ATZ16084.1 adenylosuccinate lyase [Entomoplasma freundtii]TDY57014.1 adenylosuccinate lyase [Entomoplasma freundtii]
MIKRYEAQAISKIWSDKNKYQTWLEVEKLVVEGWVSLGVVPKKDTKAYANLKVDLDRMAELEKTLKHDVVAFTRMLGEQIGLESRWLHLGITSTDVVDTAQNYLIKQSNLVLEQVLQTLQTTLKNLAFKYENQLIMGRTHGIYGEPTSLGLKFALWHEEIKRQQQRLTLARQQIEVAKISGSMGNYANLELEIEDYVANALGLGLDSLSTQVTQRDRHAFLISVLANLASTYEKMSTEIRLFQRSEVNEISEGFAPNQKGSSSMPHKKNPISSENIAGLSRYVRSFVTMGYENNNLWHERDISHSSNERLVIPDIYAVIVYLTNRLNDTLNNLYINKEQINKHLSEAHRIYFSQRVLTYILINNPDVTRESVYDFIQKCTHECLASNQDFKLVLEQQGIEKYLSQKELDSLFDDKFFLRQVPKIYKRLFANK